MLFWVGFGASTSSLDLNLSQPLDLGIPQKSLRVRLKEENERKYHSFFHEQIERRRGR